LNKENIQNRIYTIRGLKVMLDSDLAALYQVKTKQLNQAVKRNIERFPNQFMFQLTEDEVDILRSQIVTTKNEETLRFQNGTSKSKQGGRRYLPYTFTEQGVAMLSSVLRSDTAIQVSIQIMNAFVAMRKFISKNTEIFLRLDKVERKQIEYAEKFEKVFDAIQNKEIKQGIFFNGQIFDAHNFISDLIRSAKKSIVLIDNYVDDSVLTVLSKREKNTKVTIYTKNFTKQLKLDLKKFNAQYAPIEIKEFEQAHDRFIIIDSSKIYHIGASLKDLGKKWFAFSQFDKKAFKMLNKLE